MCTYVDDKDHMSALQKENTSESDPHSYKLCTYCTVLVKCKLPVASRFSRDETSQDETLVSRDETLIS